MAATKSPLMRLGHIRDEVANLLPPFALRTAWMRPQSRIASIGATMLQCRSHSLAMGEIDA